MKKLLKVLLGVWISIPIFSIDVNAFDLAKIDPKLRLLIENPQLNKLYYFHQYGIKKPVISPYTNIIIKTTANKTILKNAATKVHAVIGDIVTATVNINHINELAQLSEVDYIQASQVLSTHLDESVSDES